MTCINTKHREAASLDEGARTALTDAKVSRGSPAEACSRSGLRPDPWAGPDTGGGANGTAGPDPGGTAGPLWNGYPPGNPNPTPRCGARTRAGAPCHGPAMANGRCRMHGGGSTGPRTEAGMARMIAAKTTHGKYGATGAAQRAHDRYLRTVATRIRLLCVLRRLQGYLPPEMTARLEQGAPPELRAPMHPSQVAFLARVAAGGREGATAGVAPRAREAERLAARAERGAQASWRAAIAFARAAKRAARQERAAERAAPQGRARALGGKTENSRNDPVRGRVTGLRRGGEAADVARLAASSVTPLRDARPDQVRAGLSTAVPAIDAGRALGDQTEISRNDPMHGPAAEPRPSGEAADVVRLAACSAAPLRDVRPDQGLGSLTTAVPVMGAGRPARGETPVSRNDPMQERAAPKPTTVARPRADGATGGSPRVTRPASTKAALLRSTAKVEIWKPGLPPVLAPLLAPVRPTPYADRRKD